MTVNNLPPNPKSIKICFIEGCIKTLVAKGLCKMHYERLRVHGSPHIVLCNVGEGNTPEERFWSRVEKTATCWNWAGALSDGYGTVRYKQKHWKAHRLAWFFVKNEIPKLLLLHSCDNPKCVNPEHLREGTDQDNANDRKQRGREAVGEARSKKLKEKDVLEIRALFDGQIPVIKIAEIYNVNESTIHNIKKGRYWGHLK